MGQTGCFLSTFLLQRHLQWVSQPAFDSVPENSQKPFISQPGHHRERTKRSSSHVVVWSVGTWGQRALTWWSCLTAEGLTPLHSSELTARLSPDS